MASPRIPLRASLFVVLFSATAPLAGCNKAPPLTPCFPVSGTVTMNKKPLATGTVKFAPDASKGNTSKESAIGLIQPDGKYSLVTNGRSGAPLGWYKVSVEPTAVPGELPAGQAPPKPPAINAKYRKGETSGILIEVTENPKPGAYDIDLK